MLLFLQIEIEILEADLCICGDGSVNSIDIAEQGCAGTDALDSIRNDDLAIQLLCLMLAAHAFQLLDEVAGFRFRQELG